MCKRFQHIISAAYKNICILFLFCTLAAWTQGCCSDAFFAISTARNSAGGIYRITSEKSSVQLLSYPGLNTLLRASDGRFYGTSSNPAGKKDKNGTIAVFEIKKGNLIAVEARSVNGRTPCHIAQSPCGTFLYTANYSSGDLSQFKIKQDRSLSPPRLIRHSGSSITRRQRSPHPHFCGFDPAGKQLFVCDLGTDEIVVYNFIPHKGIQLPAEQKIKTAPGAGPRHLVFDPSGTVFYTANELDSTASSFVRDPLKGTWKMLKTVKTLTSRRKTKNAPGAIKITADGKYFFVTNRGDNSIAVYSADRKGNFNLLYTVESGGNFPSDLLFWENEKCLAVTHLKSGDISFFSWDPGTGKLTLQKRTETVPSGISLCR